VQRSHNSEICKVTTLQPTIQITETDKLTGIYVKVCGDSKIAWSMSTSFEELSFQLLSYIEALPGFRDLEKNIRPGTTVASVNAWCDKNDPFMLPDDLLGLLEFSDGLFVRWRALSLETEIVVGSFSINKLVDIVRMDDSPTTTAPPPTLSSEDGGESGDGGMNSSTNITTAAFVFERNPKVGDVALVYTLDEKVNYMFFDFLFCVFIT
jgi:hypothetical protein